MSKGIQDIDDAFKRVEEEEKEDGLGELLFEIPAARNLPPAMRFMKRAMRFNLLAMTATTLMVIALVTVRAFTHGLDWWMPYLVSSMLVALLMVTHTPFDYAGTAGYPGTMSFLSFLRIAVTWPAIFVIHIWWSLVEFFSLDDRAFFVYWNREGMAAEEDDLSDEERREREA